MYQLQRLISDVGSGSCDPNAELYRPILLGILYTRYWLPLYRRWRAGEGRAARRTFAYELIGESIQDEVQWVVFSGAPRISFLGV